MIFHLNIFLFSFLFSIQIGLQLRQSFNIVIVEKFLLSCLFRCDFFYCSAGKEKFGFKNGMLLIPRKKKRKLCENLFQLLLHGNPKCAIFWNGRILRLSINGTFSLVLTLMSNHNYCFYYYVLPDMRVSISARL